MEYLFPIGWAELEGIANRGDFDLTQHAQHSGERLEYHDPQSGARFVPHVIEPAAGVGRSVLAFLFDAYDEDEIGGEKRTVLRLHPPSRPEGRRAPAAAQDGQPELAREVFEALRRRMKAEYDEGGAIGRRYRRQDEIGTPFAVTSTTSRSRTARSPCASATPCSRSASRSTRSPATCRRGWIRTPPEDVPAAAWRPDDVPGAASGPGRRGPIAQARAAGRRHTNSCLCRAGSPSFSPSPRSPPRSRSSPGAPRAPTGTTVPPRAVRCGSARRRPS